MQKKLNKKVDLKFSTTQFKKALPYVTRLNRSLIKQRNKDQLEILKAENASKAKKLKKLKLQDRLQTLKAENSKKAKYLDKIKKNTLKKMKINK